MHELSLCRRVLAMIDDSARDNGFNSVKSVVLSIGSLSCIDPDAFQFGFNALKKNTIASDADLELHTIPAAAHCPLCRRDVAIKSYGESCPDCGNALSNIIAGNEMQLTRLEVQ